MGRLWFAHGLGALSLLLLAGAGSSWLVADPSQVASRLGLGAVEADAEVLAGAVGFFKGLLDLWPLPLAGWFVARADWSAVAAVWAVAAVFIPVADLVGSALAGVPSLVHVAYAAAMGGASVAYLQVNRSAP
jgi:hypothetical protein